MAAEAMTPRGRFITLEGIDGAGKSSHQEFLCERVRAKGHAVLLTREPGGTPFGERLREVVLHHDSSALAEALVMFADRSAHVEGEIEPALHAGVWVVCDRFSDSTFAYQCGGRGLGREVFAQLEQMVHPGLQPDVTFLFDIDPATAHQRQRSRSREADGIESRGLDYFMRVRDAYLERQRQSAGRIRVVDSSGSIEEVRQRLEASFREAFP